MVRPARVISTLVLVVAGLAWGGIPAGAVVSRDLATDPAEFVAYGSKSCDRLGLSITMGDINGDGYADVASGAPLDEQGNVNFNQGALHVYFGNAGFSGQRNSAQPGSPDLIIYGEKGRTLEDCGNKQADVLGKGVAMGDVNGDGRDDLAVGSVRASGVGTAQQQVGKVYVFYQPVPPATWPSVIDLSTPGGLAEADVVILGDLKGGDFGIHLAIGDFDADNFDDILIGAPAVLVTSTQAGGFRVVYGSASLPSSIDMANPPAGVDTFKVNGATFGDKLGHGVAAGDVNGDAIPDMVAGAPRGEGPCSQATGPGLTYVFYGSSTAPPTGTWNLATTPAPYMVTGPQNTDQLGRRVAVGDVTGDGTGDLIMGARCTDGPAGADAGAGYVIQGPLPGPPGPVSRDLSTQPADLTVNGASAGDFLGVGPGAGDINDDGKQDLILGADEGDGPTNTRSAAGEVVVLFGSATLTGTRNLATSPADITVYSPNQGDKLGRFVAAGDVNNDGVTDLGVTAYLADGFNNATGNETGEFNVLTDLAGGGPVLPTVTITASDPNAAEPGADTGQFTITRTGDTTSPLTVNYTIGGTATNGTDYTMIGTSAVIAASSATTTVTITPINDPTVEGPETVILTLAADPAYTVGVPNSATVTIADDDSGPACTQTGTAGDDVMQGGSGNDVLCGLGGNDTLTGGGGDDLLLGGDGNDTLKGGNGNDTSRGEGGNDTISDSAGNDTLEGGDGTDKLKGIDLVSGNDTLDGGAGTADQCSADAGDTVINCP